MVNQLLLQLENIRGFVETVIFKNCNLVTFLNIVVWCNKQNLVDG
jgi:hypothetical protein